MVARATRSCAEADSAGQLVPVLVQLWVDSNAVLIVRIVVTGIEGTVTTRCGPVRMDVSDAPAR